ncbi:14147_t:CDS:2, partial [Racocetra persica]
VEIARAAFTEAAVPVLTNEHYAFTLAVYDIFLNPRSKSINDYSNSGPSYNSAESIIDDKTTALSQGEKSRQAFSEPELGSFSQGSGSMSLSQDEMDELFATGLDINNNYDDK